MKYMGILLPETNTVVEHEIVRMIAEDPEMLDKISPHFSRIEVKKDYAKNESDFLKELDKNKEKACGLLEFIPLDVFGFFCTSAVVLRGTSVQIVNNIPCLDPIQALVAACVRFAPRKVLLFSPYSRSTSQLVESNLSSGGVPVSKSVFLDLSMNIDKYSFDRAKSLLADSLRGDTNLVIISCTNFRTLDLISFFERELDVPVVSSNQALFWAMCKEIDVKCHKLIKYGSLFQF